MSSKYDYENGKATVEALLFATNGLTIKEIVKKTKMTEEKVEKILDELEMEYLKKSKGVHIIKEGEVWKMSVKPEHTPDIKDLLPPEMPKALIKTLAVIAAKKPVKQSIVVRVRGNKAYGHVKKLEKLGFITSEKFGTTQMLDLTEKFFSYFSVVESDFNQKISQEIQEKINPETKKRIEKIEAEDNEKQAKL